MIEAVESFDAELKLHVLPYRNVLEQTDIAIRNTRTTDDSDFSGIWAF